MVEENKIIKNLDFSAFNHNTSVIPREFYNFFSLTESSIPKKEIILIGPKQIRYKANIRHADKSRSTPVKMIAWNKDFQDFLKSQFRSWETIVQGDKPTHYKLEFYKTDSEIIFDIATKKINSSLSKLKKDPKRDVLVPDSYIYPQNKKGKGAGESKLYIGNQNNDTYQFWGNVNDVVEVEIDKKSLLKYYFDIENEFKFPTQDYRDQNKMISSFKECFIDINNLENKISIKFTVFSGPKDAERVYLKTADERSKMINTLIRKVSLHPFTNLQFIKIMKNKYILELKHIKKIENEIEDSVNPINIEGFVNTHKSEYDTHVTDKKLRDLVLSIHNYKCQFCKNKYEYINTSLERVGYAEGAHIKAKNPTIGGEDKLDNLLCLCPTCHKLFDLGALWMDDELTVRDIDGGIVYQLTEIDEHPINIQNIRFHRNHFKERRD